MKIDMSHPDVINGISAGEYYLVPCTVYERTQKERDDAWEERDKALEERAEITKTLGNVMHECAAACVEASAERDEAIEQRDQALEDLDDARAGREALRAQRDKAIKERDQWKECAESWRRQSAELCEERDESRRVLSKALGEVEAERDKAIAERDALVIRKGLANEADKAQKELSDARRCLDVERKACAEAIKERDQWKACAEDARREADRAIAWRNRAIDAHNEALAERNHARAIAIADRKERDKAIEERDESRRELSKAFGEVGAERDEAIKERDQAIEERDQWKACAGMVIGECHKAIEERDAAYNALEALSAAVVAEDRPIAVGDRVEFIGPTLFRSHFYGAHGLKVGDIGTVKDIGPRGGCQILFDGQVVTLWAMPHEVRRVAAEDHPGDWVAFAEVFAGDRPIEVGDWVAFRPIAVGDIVQFKKGNPETFQVRELRRVPGLDLPGAVIQNAYTGHLVPLKDLRLVVGADQ